VCCEYKTSENKKQHNFKIIYIFQVAIAFVVTGILALVFSDRISGDLLIDEEGHIENGDKYAIIGGLAGATSILAGIILAIITGNCYLLTLMVCVVVKIKHPLTTNL
jgi:hypothetical protein